MVQAAAIKIYIVTTHWCHKEERKKERQPVQP